MIINFFYEFAYLLALCLNPYFDDFFYVWYAIILLPLVAATAVMTVFLLGFDEAKNRRFIPHACVAAGASSFLVVAWIAIYIGAIYPKLMVNVSRMDRILEGEYGAAEEDFIE